MNILHLATTYPLHEADSNASFVEALAEGLCRRGHQVHVLLPYHPDLELEREGRQAHLHSFKTTPLPGWHPWGYAQALTADRSLRWDAYAATPYAAVSAARSLRRIMRERHIDVVHANWLLPAAPIAAWALRRATQPLVVSCHGSGVFLAEKRGWAASAARWGLQRASALTACSRDLATRATAVGAGLPAEWIPYGVDIGNYRPATPEERREIRETLAGRLGIHPDAPCVLAVGRLVYKKGFGDLIRAMPQIREIAPGTQLLIAGDGPLREDLLDAATRSGVGDAVHLLGAASRAELIDIYRATDVVAVPSVHGPGGNVDGLPNVFLEALATGAAVVATRVGGIPDIGRDGETVVLVEESDVSALAVAIGELLIDDHRRNRLGAAARSDAEKRLDWSSVAARFEGLYESVIDT